MKYDSDFISFTKVSICVVIVILIVAVVGFLIAYYDSNVNLGDSLRIESMKRDYRDKFNHEMRNQYDTETEFYVIMPEQYGREEIDNFADELGHKYKYNLISVEFRYNHVIYKYRKNEFYKRRN